MNTKRSFIFSTFTLLLLSLLTISSIYGARVELKSAKAAPPPKSGYKHEASEVEFPQDIGEFEMGMITNFDKYGFNTSIRYSKLTTPPVSVTVYLYPIMRGGSFSEVLINEAKVVEHSILYSGEYENSARDFIAICHDEHELPGVHAEYVSKKENSSKYTILFLFVLQGWTHKYRITAYGDKVETYSLCEQVVSAITLQHSKRYSRKWI